jgi:hypothetical protein
VKGHPQVWAVVLHYGPLHVTLRCLRALDRVRYPRLRVALVDNSGWGKELLPGLHGLRRRPVLIPMHGNVGFARGVNAGMRAALRGGAGWIWWLNNDATPAPDALAALVREGERDPKTGVVGSRILDDTVPPRIWHAGATLDLRTGFTVSRGAGQPDRGQLGVAADVDWVTGCSLLVRDRVLRTVGLVDERFVMYYEETDFCTRIREAGWRVRYCPTSRVVHHVAGREGRQDGSWMYWETRNRLLLLRKHAPARVLPAMLGMLRWPIGSMLVRGRLRAALASVRGLFSFLGLLVRR